jgi:uncharacterized protein
MTLGLKLNAVQEAIFLWALAFLAIVVAFIFWTGHSTLVATICFLYLPLLSMHQRGEDHRDYGVNFSRWREDLKLFGILFALLVPLFFVGFWAFAEIAQLLPPRISALLSPLRGPVSFQPRLPDRFPEWMIHHLLVVALPEEFFYRGFIQTRLRDAWPQGKMFLGARLGPAFFATAALFAVGHLAIFLPWRLAVFFPALIFGWMRERTGTVLGATLFHAACNLYLAFLQTSFYGN